MRTPVRQVFRRVEKHRREIRVRGRSRINKNDRAMCRYRNDVSRNTITVVWHQRQKLYRCPRQHGARARSVQSALVTGNVDFAFSIRMNLTKKVHLVIIIYDLFQITTQLNYDLLRTLKFIKRHNFTLPRKLPNRESTCVANSKIFQIHNQRAQSLRLRSAIISIINRSARAWRIHRRWRARTSCIHRSPYVAFIFTGFYRRDCREESKLRRGQRPFALFVRFAAANHVSHACRYARESRGSIAREIAN